MTAEIERFPQRFNREHRDNEQYVGRWGAFDVLVRPAQPKNQYVFTLQMGDERNADLLISALLTQGELGRWLWSNVTTYRDIRHSVPAHRRIEDAVTAFNRYIHVTGWQFPDKDPVEWTGDAMERLT